MLTLVATALCFALAFSSMLLSWYILMPRKNKDRKANTAH